MKYYNVQNYIRYKEDLAEVLKRLEGKEITELTRNELIEMHLPLVETTARRFATSDQASGVMDITDLIQEGSYGLCAAVDKIEWDVIKASDKPRETLISFIYKRVKGAIRRSIDINRGDMRIPEHKLNEIRKTDDKSKLIVQMFFNSIFSSIDAEQGDEEDNMMMQIEDVSKPYNIDLMNKYILFLMSKHLNDTEYHVLRMSFGLDCDKMPAKNIADALDIKGTANYVRVSQIKRDAIDKLIEKVDADQVLDLMN